MDLNQTPRRSAARNTTRWGFAAAATASCLIAGIGSAAPVSVGAHPAAPSPTTWTHTGAGFADSKWGDATADSVSKDSYGKNQAERDPGSLFTIEKAIGARNAWGKRDRSGQRLTGQGVGVAVLDSGVNQVPGLDGQGKVAYGPDLSIEANGPLTQQDTFGHGTFMAGIIAGRATTRPADDLPGAPANVQLGIAPDASLLAMKLATTDGSTDVSEVIAAIDWVTQHPTLPDGTPIRIINLSYGTDSTQPYQADPLAAAADNAWRHGIVVVTSAGNSGSASLTDPAVDPTVVAVGAADSSDRLDGWAHDHTRVAAFSNGGGSTTRNVDLVAPGISVVSLRSPGSEIDDHNPSGLVAGDTSGRLFRGSGTSEAAAVVSGASALILQAYPSLTPDQLKYALTAGADSIGKTSDGPAGAGMLNLNRSLDVAAHILGTDNTATTMRAAAVQSYTPSTGQGSIDAARGSSVLLDANGNALSGEIDVQGNPWNPAAWWRATSTLSSWSEGAWMGATWTGDGWQANSSDLSSARWSSARWSSARWSSARWSGVSWDSARWSSARWSSARWSSARWSSLDS